MRITEISVTGLFGIFDHTIRLKEEGVTVLHSANGVGKTTILRMTNGILSGKIDVFANIKFKEYKINIENNQFFNIKNNQTEFEISIEFESSKTKKNLLIEAEKINKNSLKSLKNTAAWKKLMKNASVSFLSTDRLITEEEDEMNYQVYTVPTVTTFPNNLKNNIQEALADYGLTSQRLDSSFPQRLLASRGMQSPDLVTLRNDFKKIDAIKKAYSQIGLLDEDQSTNFFNSANIQEEDAKVLHIYAEDNLTKLKSLNNIYVKLSLLINMINNRFLYKKIIINKEIGFEFNDMFDSKISLENLSSGEQHEVIMWYDFLFKTPDGALLLIDEPETSLHVTWQLEFLNDMLKIAKLRNLTVIVATHSPDIINGRKDLTVVLTGPELPQKPQPVAETTHA